MVTLGVIWYYFKVLKGPLLGWTGVTLRVFWEYFWFWTTLRIAWGHFGVTMGFFGFYPGVILGVPLGELIAIPDYFEGSLMVISGHYEGPRGLLGGTWGHF